MKRFVLFAGFNYYPGGGWSDMRGAFDSKDAAEDKAFELFDAGERRQFETGETKPNDIDWFHVVSLETLKIVSHGPDAVCRSCGGSGERLWEDNPGVCDNCGGTKAAQRKAEK